MNEPKRPDERDNRDHPNNVSALWHLAQRAPKVAADGSIIIEDKARKRLDIDATCICFDRDADQNGGDE